MDPIHPPTFHPFPTAEGLQGLLLAVPRGARCVLVWLRGPHTEKYFLNLVESTRNQIVFTIFRLIWIQTEVRLDPNQWEDLETYKQDSENIFLRVGKHRKLDTF